jgi:hypothetical protein
MARAFLARVLWLQGFPEQAMRTVESSVEDARAPNHAISLCHALALAGCPISLWLGDLAAAEHYTEMMLENSIRLPRWHTEGRANQAVLAIKRGDVRTGLPLLRASFDGFGEARTALGHFMFLETLVEAFGRAGQIAEGFAAIKEALAWTEQTESRWAIAELLRVKGELLLSQGGSEAAAAAEDHYQQALGWARRQGALSWELRTATSLARLLCDQNRSTEAVALLAPVYDRFTEGFETADLKAAKALIDGFYDNGEHKAPALVELNPGTARRRVA